MKCSRTAKSVTNKPSHCLDVIILKVIAIADMLTYDCSKQSTHSQSNGWTNDCYSHEPNTVTEK